MELYQINRVYMCFIVNYSNYVAEVKQKVWVTGYRCTDRYLEEIQIGDEMASGFEETKEFIRQSAHTSQVQRSSRIWHLFQGIQRIKVRETELILGFKGQPG